LRLSDQELVELFQPCLVPVVDQLAFLEIVERESDVPRALIRPTDRFDLELAPEVGWEFDDGVALIPEIVAQRFGGKPLEYDLKEYPTVRDLLCRIQELDHDRP
jgi:hypothetical protein